MGHTPSGAGRVNAALHEAGHAVARLHLFGDLSKVWVNSKGGGATEYPEMHLPTTPESALKALAVFVFAGAAAVRRLGPAHSRPDYGLESDMQQLSAIAYFGGFSPAAMMGFADDASRFVVDHESEIRAVKKRLLLCGSLRGGAVATIAAAARGEQAA